MPYPYTPPQHLQGQSADEIHRRMMNDLPEDIDKSELQFPWDFTRPPAIEKAKFVEFDLNETIKLIFPHWAYNEWLKYHAQLQGVTPREANRASGKLNVTGKLGLIIEQGFQFATVANIASSIIFETTEMVVFSGTPDGKGNVVMEVPIRAVEGGIAGNVPPDTIILMVKPDSNITFVTNPEATTGGASAEIEDVLRERILEATRGGSSFTGCDSDYVRWAMEISAVGNVMVDPEWDDPNLPEEFHWIDAYGVQHCAGAVRLFIVDENGSPANQQILDAVYEHIIRPDNRLERLAPIGATLTVAAPVPLVIDISATVVLHEDEDFETVKSRFKENLNGYWLAASTENDIKDIQSGIAQNYVKWVFVGSTLAQTAGIADYTVLTVNGGTGNILIPLGQFPVTGEVDLYV